MSVELKIRVESFKDVFHIYDVTGSYDKAKNTGGWGGSNEPISSVDSSVIIVTLPNDGGEISLSMEGKMPNTECIGVEMVPADVSLDSFPPGVYKFTYNVLLISGITLSVDCFYFYYEPLSCCISKKKMKTDLNDASSVEARKVIELEALLKNAIWCACSGRMKCAQEISDYIWTNCGCCC